VGLFLVAITALCKMVTGIIEARQEITVATSRIHKKRNAYPGKRKHPPYKRP
jgi:hypothetical protein